MAKWLLLKRLEILLLEQHEEVEEKLNQVTEFVRIIQEEDGFPDQFFFDVRPSLKRVRIEGMYLDEQELFDLRRSLETIRDIVRFQRKALLIKEFWRGGRVVDCGGLENRCTARYPGFESLSLRWNYNPL